MTEHPGTTPPLHDEPDASVPLAPLRRSEPPDPYPVLPHLTVGTGPPVVLLPGLGPQHTGLHPHHRALRRLEVGLLARSFTIIPRPTGLRERTTIKDLANRYAATITAHFTSPVDLIGISTGGSIALQLAIDHPHITNRLVLLSAAYRLGDDGRTAQQDIAKNLKLRRPRRAAATMLATTTTTTTRPAQRQLRRATGLALGRLALGQKSEDLIAILEAEDRFDVHADLPRVTSPTLVIGGGRDGYYPADLFTQTAAGVAHGTLVQLPKKSHLGLATDRTVRRTITDFLTTTPALAGAAAPPTRSRGEKPAPLSRHSQPPRIASAKPVTRTSRVETVAAGQGFDSASVLSHASVGTQPRPIHCTADHPARRGTRADI